MVIDKLARIKIIRFFQKFLFPKSVIWCISLLDLAILEEVGLCDILLICEVHIMLETDFEIDNKYINTILDTLNDDDESDDDMYQKSTSNNQKRQNCRRLIEEFLEEKHMHQTLSDNYLSLKKSRPRYSKRH